MALSFDNFISSIQIFNTWYLTIIALLTSLSNYILLKNNFFMVESTGVRGPTLARLATVSVCRAGGKPSTRFPPGTRRAEIIVYFDYKFMLLHVEALNYKFPNKKLIFKAFSGFSKLFLDFSFSIFSKLFRNRCSPYKLRFARPWKLIFTQNKTSIWYL